MLFMLIIKVKYWLFNYKLPLVRLAAGCQAPAGWEEPVIQDKSYKLLRPVLHAIPGLELKKLSRALIHSIFIPGRPGARLGSLETLKKFPSVSFQL